MLVLDFFCCRGTTPLLGEERLLAPHVDRGVLLVLLRHHKLLGGRWHPLVALDDGALARGRLLVAVSRPGVGHHEGGRLEFPLSLQ